MEVRGYLLGLRGKGWCRTTWPLLLLMLLLMMPLSIVTYRYPLVTICLMGTLLLSSMMLLLAGFLLSSVVKSLIEPR